MSVSYIPEKIKIRLWGKAAGRCEYPGCNDPLWRDDVTQVEFNSAYIAHIIADQPTGPRGDLVLSKKLKGDISNLMLLCDKHHRLIDKEQVEEHPVDLLQKYKSTHEVEMELLTGMLGNKKSHILFLTFNIGERHAVVNFESARKAMLPDYYPATPYPFEIDLTKSGIEDDDPKFWEGNAQEISTLLKRHASLLAKNDTNAHLSVFALAPIPLLIHFGRELGDIFPAQIFQLHRDTQSWEWQEFPMKEFKYIITKPESPKISTQHIVLKLSLSGKIHDSEVSKILKEEYETYEITLQTPDRDFLKSKEQFELFSHDLMNLFAEIRANYGENSEIHLFPAIPVSIAVEFGRRILPKVDLPINIYDHNKKLEGFAYTLKV